MRAAAWFLGHRIDARALPDYLPLGVAPRTVQVGNDGYAVLFRFGAAVFYNLDEEGERQLIALLQQSTMGIYAEPELEEAQLLIDPGQNERLGRDGEITLREASVERLQVVAEVLAKSTVLAYYERRVSEVFERVEDLAAQLQRGGRIARNRDLLREIGNVLMIQARTVGRAGVVEKPEITWDYPDLDRLYEYLAVEYELRERDLALGRKLEVIANTAETYLDLLHNRRSLRVEWYIVILIVVEIVLSVYQLIFAG